MEYNHRYRLHRTIRKVCQGHRYPRRHNQSNKEEPKRNPKHEQFQRDLPQDIICNIISRLPIQSIVRFRVVSKSWLHFLKQDCSFTALYRDRFILSRRDKTPSTHDLTDFYLVEKLQSHSWNVAKVPFVHELQHKLRLEVVATCNGLLCLAGAKDPFVKYIYNPITRESQRVHQFDSIFREWICFGFDAKTMKYKLLMMDNNLAGYITTLGETCWRKLDIPSGVRFPSTSDELKNICFNGELYWVVAKHSKCILVMDINSEKFRIINFPNPAARLGKNLCNKVCRVIVFQKSLALVAIGYRRDENWRVKMHISKLVNGKEGIWSDVKTYDGVFSDVVVRVLGTVDDDSLLLSTSSLDENREYDLVVYTPESGEIVRVLEGPISTSFTVFTFAPSFVPLSTTGLV